MRYIFFIFLTLSAYGSLTPLAVKESALKFHPTVLAALEKMREGEEAVNGARGAFDSKFVSDYKKQTKGDYDTTLSRSFLEKPLRVANSKVYAGLEYIRNPRGMLSPIYNTGNPTSQTGSYHVLGFQMSLWKNLTLDPDRAGFRNAKYDASIAKAEKKLTEWDIARLSQLAYWEWVTARRVKNAYEQLLQNGIVRNEYLDARFKRGDSSQILVKENEQYVANRKGSLMSAKERLIRAEYALALFYRNESAEPIVPSEEQEFEDYPSHLNVLLDSLDLKSDIDELIKKRPDMNNLALNVKKTEVDLELAKQDLRPKVDLTTEYYQRTQENINMPRDYLMVMAQVSVPIERNLGNGHIAAAQARKMVASREMSLGQQTYKYEVMAMRQALSLQLEHVTQSEIEFSRAKELVVAETYKFKQGGGNLYLVNLREEAQASAEASYHESRLAFMSTFLSYQALVGTGED